MRWSRTFLPTLREDPSEAESASHKLMLRAGIVRRLSAGVYSYLPLGLLSLLKATAIVREEMNRAGAHEVLLPAMSPPELWKETGRYEAFGDTLMKVKDRKGTEHVLGPTHEEIITHLVRNEIASHRQLPFTLYQIQNKFRDEPRPRFGVVRTREFIMKDAYSFDADEEGMNRTYQAMYDAYVRIFTRAGLKFMPVEADAGLMGGDVSHEFISPSVSGEDVVVHCSQCTYAANRERAECAKGDSRLSLTQTEELLPTKDVDTPGVSTVEDVAAFLKISPSKLVKTLLFTANGEPVAALIRGDHEVNPAKLARAAGTTAIEMATPEQIQKFTGGPVGFSGPVGLKARMIADHAISGSVNFVTGANRKDAHTINVNCSRDFKPDQFADIRLALPGDPCPRCGSELKFTEGIEIGHVFKLGTLYTGKMGANFQDEKGTSRPIVMGCYGIGVNRILASAVENHHDEHGILWPKNIAPRQVEVVSINPAKEEIRKASEEVVGSLEKAGWEVLWDDRDQPAGVKFTDADLVGIPLRVTVGARTLKAGTVDLKLRTEKDQKGVPVNDIAEAVKDAWNSYPF